MLETLLIIWWIGIFYSSVYLWVTAISSHKVKYYKKELIGLQLQTFFLWPILLFWWLE